MLKYKNDYYIIKSNSDNKDDNYIPCRKKVQIYRYSSSLLAIQFNSNKYANAKIKELEAIGISLTRIQCGDNEQVYTFLECFLSQVSEVVKAKKRIKRYLSEEQKEELRTRLKNIRNKKL